MAQFPTRTSAMGRHGKAPQVPNGFSRLESSVVEKVSLQADQYTHGE
jgi:hypothetical protein